MVRTRLLPSQLPLMGSMLLGTSFALEKTPALSCQENPKASSARGGGEKREETDFNVACARHDVGRSLSETVCEAGCSRA